jgi:hypothetical protein
MKLDVVKLFLVDDVFPFRLENEKPLFNTKLFFFMFSLIVWYDPVLFDGDALPY